MDIISSTAVKQRTVMHLFTAIVFMLLGKVTAFQSRGVCPTGWQIWEMSCYKSLSPLKTNWQEALESCHDLGANLLTPNSTEELDFIWSTFWASAPNGVWIGCTDEEGNKLLECNEEAQYVSYSYRYFGGWELLLMLAGQLQFEMNTNCRTVANVGMTTLKFLKRTHVLTNVFEFRKERAVGRFSWLWPLITRFRY